MTRTDLQVLVDSAVTQTVAAFAGRALTAEQLAITLVDLRDAARPVLASHRGQVQVYPASVIKLFYMVAAHRWMEDGQLADTPELRRAMRDMIVDSGNESTGYVVDCLTGTTSGPELSTAEMEQWHDKRNAVNRYFTKLGFTNINVNKKPWCEGPYGREKLALSLFQPTRNWLTTEATARLLVEIVTDQLVSPARCAEMRELLHRDFAVPADPENPDDQTHTFIGKGLPAGAKLWSKGGWMSDHRHDAAYVELPGGAKFVLVSFTKDHSKDREIIPHVARLVAAGMSGK